MSNRKSEQHEPAHSARTESGSYSERATAAAHDAVDRIGEQAERAEERIRGAAGDVRRRSYEARDRARELSDEATMTARSYLREHPLASLAVAFGVGMLFSSIMRR